MSALEVTYLEMSDGTRVHVGDERLFRAVSTGTDEVKQEATQYKIRFTAPSGTSVTFAKTPTGDEQPMIKAEDGNWYAKKVLDEDGEWHVVAAASGNISEVEPMKLLVYPAPFAPL